MRPNELSELLIAAIQHRAPILITGAPGIGKTDIVTHAAEASGADLIVSHPVVSDPTDAKGLPWPDTDKRRATFLPFGDLARALEATRPTVWFLDDLGQAAPSVQDDAMQLRDALSAAITEASELIRAREVEMRLAGPQQAMGAGIAAGTGANLTASQVNQLLAQRAAGAPTMPLNVARDIIAKASKP